MEARPQSDDGLRGLAAAEGWFSKGRGKNDRKTGL